MLIIKNGTIVDPSNKIEKKASLIIEDGKIKAISDDAAAESFSRNTQCEVIDAKGCIVAPALVDVHVHFRDPGFTYKEDINTGAKAALKGGFGSVVLMANTKPPVDNEETLNYVIEKGKTTDCATVSKGMKGQALTDMETLRSKGAAGFTDDGVPLMDKELLTRAMQKAAALNVPISLHEENPALITNNGINRGKASEHFGIGGSPREAEISLIERDLEIALETGAPLNIQHISTKEGVELVRRAKRRGDNIHAEATPHHFSLTEEAAIKYGALAKMNPPLREEADRLAIIEGLKDNTIDIIATDHAPHSAEEKAKPITEAPSGIIGLETALPLAITNLLETGALTISEIIEKMSLNPARLYHLNAGTLSIGAPADVVVFDTGALQTVGGYTSKSSNSPFTGKKLKGAVRYTIINGIIKYNSFGCSAYL